MGRSFFDRAVGLTDSGPLRWLLAACALAGCAEGAACGEGQAAPEADEVPGAFLYQPDRVLDLRIHLDADAAATLPSRKGEEQAEDVYAVVGFLGEKQAAGLRLKGDHSFRNLDGKAGFKIDYGEWDQGATLHGVRRLTLNNMVQDPTMLSEHLSYWLHGLVGVPAPRHGYACVSVNDELFGLYSVVETMDEQFLERAFDDLEGYLYEGGHGGDLRHGRAGTFELEEEGDGEGRTDLIDLIDALDAATPETFLEVLGRHFALDELLGMWAVELFTGNRYCYLNRANNFLLYHEPSTDLWSMIPWGADQAFVEHLDPYDPYDPISLAEHGRLYEDCLASPACLDALELRLEEVMAIAQEEELFDQAVQQRHFIADLSRGDPRSGYSGMGTRKAQNDLLRFIDRRPSKLGEQLEEGG